MRRETIDHGEIPGGSLLRVVSPIFLCVLCGKAFKKGGEIDMDKEPGVAQKLIGDIAPKLAELTDEVLFGDVWERSELSKRDRSLITVAALIAMNRPEQLRFHLDRALDNGLAKEELIEVITHLAFYSGWPNAMTAITTAREQFAKRDAAG